MNVRIQIKGLGQQSSVLIQHLVRNERELNIKNLYKDYV